MNYPRSITRVFLVTAVGMLAASADVVLNPIFGDHMVLQREKPLPVWGTASPNERITVTFNGFVERATADAAGKWMVRLPAQKLSKVPAVLSVKGNNEITLSDILVGDVWLGTGQSNMDWVVSGTDGKEAVQKSMPGQYDGIRLFKVGEAVADEPLREVKGAWTEARKETVMGFSATLFFFGESLKLRQPDVPLGLIRSSLGATNAFSWIPNEVRDTDGSTAYLREWWGNATKGWTPEKQEERDKQSAAYEEQVAAYRARKESTDSLKKPGELMGPRYSRRPSGLYNGMIAPLHPVALRGVIWYQGEWDSKKDWVKVYRGTLAALAKSWRSNWAKAAGDPALGDFPFYLVQLPSRISGDGDYWPFMREIQQQLATDIPNSGFVTTFDLNDGKELHPVEKVQIGKRLANLALAREYGQKVAYHGPLYRELRVVGDHLVLRFDIGADTLKSTDGEPLRNFEIAGADGVYHPATVKLNGDLVEVSSAAVPKPATVRYGWMPTPERPNFVNSADLPASPFRTDPVP
ncbi:9-O-acetylesterase [Luteolibacter sp. LG18]|nr:9-O-acetylesterase [Luteolibacter sp. LG18]